jgi:hypothetical protein
MRWYDPETGRWLSKDPIGLSGGLNLYVFCGNNSLCFIDRRGCNIVVVVTGAIVAGYIIFKVYNYISNVSGRMKMAGTDDLREITNGGIDCIGYMFDWFSPHGVVPNESSIFTDPIDNIITTPIKEEIINRIRQPNRNDGCDYDDAIRPLRD